MMYVTTLSEKMVSLGREKLSFVEAQLKDKALYLFYAL